MESHVFQTKIRKRGCLELKNLPFKEGTAIEISISRKERKKNLQNLILQRHFVQRGYLLDFPFSMRLISKVISVLNPSHHFQRFIHVESSQGQNYLQENPKLRGRNGRSFFPPILFSNAREKNEPACTSTCGGSIL